MGKVSTWENVLQNRGIHAATAHQVNESALSLDTVKNLKAKIEPQIHLFSSKTGLGPNAESVFVGEDEKLLGHTLPKIPADSPTEHLLQYDSAQKLLLTGKKESALINAPKVKNSAFDEMPTQLMLSTARRNASKFTPGSQEYTSALQASFTENAASYNQHLRIQNDPANPQHRLRINLAKNGLSSEQAETYEAHVNAYNLSILEKTLSIKEKELRELYKQNGWQEVGVDIAKDPAGYFAKVSTMDPTTVSHFDAWTTLNLSAQLEKENPNLRKDDAFIAFQKNLRTQLWQSHVDGFKKLESNFNKLKNEQGFLGKTGDVAKNTIGVQGGLNNYYIDSNNGSDAVKAKFEKAKSACEALTKLRDFNGTHAEFQKAYQDKMGDFSKALMTTHDSVGNYSESQNEWREGLSDLGSGVAASAAIGLTPFTGGGSLALLGTLGLGATAAATTKVMLEGADALHGGRDYTLSEAGQDALFAGISGATGGATNMFSKQLLKSSALQHSAPWLQRVISNSSESAVMGGVNGVTRTAYKGITNGDSAETVFIDSIESGVTQAVGGAVAGPVTSEALRATGKGLFLADRQLNKWAATGLAKLDDLTRPPKGPQFAFATVGNGTLPKTDFSNGNSMTPLGAGNNPLTEALNPTKPLMMAMSGDVKGVSGEVSKNRGETKPDKVDVLEIMGKVDQVEDIAKPHLKTLFSGLGIPPKFWPDLNIRWASGENSKGVFFNTVVAGTYNPIKRSIQLNSKHRDTTTANFGFGVRNTLDHEAIHSQQHFASAVQGITETRRYFRTVLDAYANGIHYDLYRTSNLAPKTLKDNTTFQQALGLIERRLKVMPNATAQQVWRSLKSEIPNNPHLKELDRILCSQMSIKGLEQHIRENGIPQYLTQPDLDQAVSNRPSLHLGAKLRKNEPFYYDYSPEEILARKFQNTRPLYSSEALSSEALSPELSAKLFKNETLAIEQQEYLNVLERTNRCFKQGEIRHPEDALDLVYDALPRSQDNGRDDFFDLVTPYFENHPSNSSKLVLPENYLQ